jgi:hypothetical protein
MRNKTCTVVTVALVSFTAIGCSAAAAPEPTQPIAHASTSPVAAITADCTAGQLDVALEGSSQPGAGEALAIVYLWDQSGSACVLGGPVTITGLNRAGRQVTSSVRFAVPALTSPPLTPDGTGPGKHGRMPAGEVAATMLLIAAGSRAKADQDCLGGLIDPATWHLTLASGGSLTTANASPVSGPTLTSAGGLTTCQGSLSGQQPIQFTGS